jgi:signal transduction histidine kinase
MDKLFQMFKRLHTHEEGTGIGLDMVKQMVENYGGRIEVESRLGDGTQFKVCFPRQEPLKTTSAPVDENL